MASGWKIVDGDGHDEDWEIRYESKLFATEAEATEACDYLHDKYHMDVDDGFGNYWPWFKPVFVAEGV